MVEIFRVIAIVIVASFFGKLATKIKLPAILGWLIAGMLFGPYFVEIVSIEIIDDRTYRLVVKLFECFAGVMIGSEILFKKLAAFGKQITIITLFQSLGTFVVVSLTFSIVCMLSQLPLYLAFLFGGIALATAPAPALSIVNQYRAKGPVTNTLIPLAAIDDVIGVIVFFTVISIVSGIVGGGNVSLWNILLMIFLPFIIGILTGLLSAFCLRKSRSPQANFALFIGGLLLSFGLGVLSDALIFHSFSINYLLVGMAFSGTVVNLIPQEKVATILKSYKPILSLSLLVVIVNLGMPLDYRLIIGAGLWTAIYIVSRAIGKIGFSYVGALATRAEPTVKKFLGLTLLPHSGVSLVFTGIAVGVLSPVFPEYAFLLQGTIAAAAIVNELIAVLLAKQAFTWAKEIEK